MGITVGELKELLESFDEDSEVRIMSQPAWPFEYSIQGVVLRSDFKDQEPDEDDPQESEKNHDDVFIIEGSQLCYGSKAAFEVCR